MVIQTKQNTQEPGQTQQLHKSKDNTWQGTEKN